MNQKCRHPRVQIVAREEDSEFVECLECREVFESSEFKDMAIEDSAVRRSLIAAGKPMLCELRRGVSAAGALHVTDIT